MNKHNEVTRSLEKSPGYRLGYKLIEHDKTQPVIVLVHGLASNHTRWSEFVSNTSLFNHFNCLRIDLMGHGLSLQRRRVTRQDWCNDIVSILKQEGFNKVIIIGHSLGAQVAVEFAARYPSMCSGVILIDPTFPELLHGFLKWAKKFKYLIWSAMWLVFGLNKLGLKRRRFEMRNMHELDKQTRLKLADGETISKLYMSPLADLRYIPVGNYLQDIIELLKPLPELESIYARVLAIISSGANISDRAQTSQQIHRFPRGEIQSIEADHWPLTENPEQTRKIIEQWCMQFID